MGGNWSNLGSTINNSFFFVVDKIIELQGYFLGQALYIGRIVLIIAISSAALNYALTGTGLKENVVKILKATVFFLIVIAAYPRIIGFITNWTFSLARDSIYPSVRDYFAGVTGTYTQDVEIFDHERGTRSVIQFTITEIKKNDNSHIFGDLLAERGNSRMNYTAVSPAAVFRIIYFLAEDCFSYADGSSKKILGLIPIPDVRRWVVGFVCGFVVIFTGIFALLEYLVCFLEFMLVATVGVILFPLSLWEGSKFMAEKFIGAIVGFFMKLLFCTLAIFLLIYGFISVFYFFSRAGFTGGVDQIIFIFFTCLLFFFICKSAPGVAQSLLTGTPSLSAAGAISAVGGAVAAAGAVAGVAQKAARTASGIGGNIAGAGQAAKVMKDMGGTVGMQAGAFFNSLGKSTAASVNSTLSRSLLGMSKGRDPATWRERKEEGKNHAKEYIAKKFGITSP